MADHSRPTRSRVRKAEGINSHLKGMARQRRQNLANQAAEYVPTAQITQADRRIRRKWNFPKSSRP